MNLNEKIMHIILSIEATVAKRMAAPASPVPCRRVSQPIGIRLWWRTGQQPGQPKSPFESIKRARFPLAIMRARSPFEQRRCAGRCFSLVRGSL